MNKKIANGRTSFVILAFAFVVALYPACSGDTPVGSDESKRFKDRICFEFSGHLHTVSLTSIPGSAKAVAAADGLAYVALASGAGGLRIVDTSDPQSPVLRGAAGDPDAAYDVTLAGGLAYVAFGGEGVAIVDGGDPDQPVIVGRIHTPGGAQGVVVSDTVAFVADDVIGLMLFDVGDPAAPDPMGVDNTPGRAVDVALSGALAYVADELAGLRIVNVADPEAPWLVNTVPMPDAGYSVVVDGTAGYAYVAAGSGLQVVDISTPGGETIAGSIETPGWARDVAIDGDFAFVAAGVPGLRVIDISDPGNPSEVNHVASSISTYGVSVTGDHLFVAESNGGLRVLDIANPLPVPVLATMPVDPGETVVHLDAESGTVFGAGQGTGLFGVRLGDSELVDQGSVQLPADVADLVVQDGLVYVAYDPTGTEIFDNGGGTGSFTSIGSIAYGGRIEKMAVADSVVYYATGGTVFGVFELGSGVATNLVLTGGRTTAVGVIGDFAYVASENRQMHKVDVTDPGTPHVMGTLIIAGSGEEVLVGGDYVYVVTSSNFSGAADGVEIYYAQYPGSLVRVTFVGVSYEPVSAALVGSTLYVAIGEAGVEVIDVSDPANPVRIGSISSVNDVRDVAVTGGAVFAADGSAGLFVTPAQECLSTP
jgi:hypothetical protein